MANLFGRSWTRKELLTRVGDISQLGGARPITLAEGPEAGVSAVEVRTGSGFNFTVLPGRGLDLGFAEFRGASLCWRSPTGEIAASYYDAVGEGWLRGFYGGLMVTCGFTAAGWGGEDQGQPVGLHGPASYLAARNVQVDGDWEGDDYVMWVQGRTHETTALGDHLRLTRRVWARLGESRLFVDDVVENLGHQPAPHMIAYHINPGFPVVDQGSRFISSANRIEPINEEWRVGLPTHDQFDAPDPSWTPQVFHHFLDGDADGNAYCAVVNPGFPGGGLGLYVKQKVAELPIVWEWKNTVVGNYVVGMEPSNCRGDGRANVRERGELRILAPGEKQEYHLEIGVLDGSGAIDDLKKRANASRTGARQS